MALILASVTDKTGLVAFAKKIASGEKPVSFLASGGTAAALEKGGITVRTVADFTQSPEMLGGRVKTLHPNIHAALLARNTDADLSEIKSRGIEPIDILVCNLYAFEKTVAKPDVSEADCIEHIDIGGIALLRAAAKNFDRVAVVCDPADYDAVAEEFLQKGEVSRETRKQLAAKAFALCTQYDAAITDWFTGGTEKTIRGYKKQDLRYGENSHQSATLYTLKAGDGVLGGKLLQGKELSYNNILDCDAAWRAVSLFDRPAAVVIKHLTPCGVAELGADAKPEQVYKAVEAAIACDPVSAYGSIIAVNTVFDTKALEAFGKLFVECLIAPKFTDEVKERLAAKKNWRVIEAPLSAQSQIREFRSVLGGFLVQDVDHGDPKTAEYKVATAKKPTETEMSVLHFAWKACTLVKSNSILLAAPIDPAHPELGSCSVGIGCGQPNRVDAARHAVERAGEKARGSVLASDAFFPFPDTVQVAAQAGVSAIVQPGGSIRDDLSIEECNKNGMAMLFTGVRHFKH